ncbi:MAG: YraN family protein [Lachnospiraceae bacterium]|nr:YraN family protein [Lachnospiraceae bacterium]
MNNRRTGADNEQLAADYLAKRGMRIAARNFRTRRGEIDIIGYEGGYLVFVEVKYRSTDARGGALESVNLTKQTRICRAADYYRFIHNIGDDTNIRYDVIGIQGREITWIKNAFMHVF